MRMVQVDFGWGYTHKLHLHHTLRKSVFIVSRYVITVITVEQVLPKGTAVDNVIWPCPASRPVLSTVHSHHAGVSYASSQSYFCCA